MGQRHASGFTLLEAIVALTVMALALIPLITFVAQSADQLIRAGEANERSLVMQSVLALMEPVNPMAEPAGQLPLDEDVEVSWRADLVVAPAQGVLLGTQLPGVRIGFYSLNVAVTREGQPWFEFPMRKVGYENMRSGGLLGEPPAGMGP